jgi:DNA adenine methylase
MIAAPQTTPSSPTLDHTFLRWAGSKRQILPILCTYWDTKHQRYIEPFAGSASLFFKLRPHEAVLSDLNNELIQTFRQLKYHPEEVSIALRKFKKGRQEYLKLRALSEKDLLPTERAARFIYLNRFCFNGLYRTNLSGAFNVPYGGTRSGEIPSEQLLTACSSALKAAKLLHGDFENTLNLAGKDDFVYMDPPFSVESRRVFKEYNRAVFSLDDVKRLRRWMEVLDERKTSFVVSYAECPEGKILKDGFAVQKVSVRRNIAGFAASRSQSTELIISNFKPTP